MKQVILASQSPRRKDLLTRMGVRFTVVPSDFEEHLDHARSPELVAAELALGKARDVAKHYPQAVVIGADTIVTIDGTQLGKPKDEADARATLKSLAGYSHLVTTAVVVVCQVEALELVDVVSSSVHFKPFDSETFETYLASGDWHDKAGSYGIQSGAAPLISFIEGEYDAIIGLPTKSLAQMFRSCGVTANPVQLEPPVPIK